jgi:hypothetical protein
VRRTKGDDRVTRQGHERRETVRRIDEEAAAIVRDWGKKATHNRSTQTHPREGHRGVEPKCGEDIQGAQVGRARGRV